MTSPTPSLPAAIREALTAFRVAVRNAERMASDSHYLREMYDREDAARTALEAHLMALVARAEADAALLDQCRVALRSIGSVYYHVESAARRAAKGGNEKASDALEHVYGRLYWLDHALGTMRERVAADSRARASISTPPEDTTPHE